MFGDHRMNSPVNEKQIECEMLISIFRSNEM